MRIMCYKADDVFKTEIILCVLYNSNVWLGQANHVFHSLQIASNLEDYVFMKAIYFTFAISNAREDTPPGYLFLCPKEDFQIGLTSFRWPNCPAYWSLDPEGIEALSTEEAARLGFPSFQLSTSIHGDSWDASVYAGLRQFHQAKGFDPESQDIARNLGCPLYELCGDVNSPFAHVDDFDEAEETAEDTHTDDEWAEAQSSLNEDSGCDEGHVGEASIWAEPDKQPVPKVDRGSRDGYTGANNEAGLKPQTANNPPTGGGFIHRILGALRHSLVVEANSDNIDTDPISPFPI